MVRHDPATGNAVLGLFNFGPEDATGLPLKDLGASTWKEVLNSNAKAFGGDGTWLNADNGRHGRVDARHDRVSIANRSVAFFVREDGGMAIRLMHRNRWAIRRTLRGPRIRSVANACPIPWKTLRIWKPSKPTWPRGMPKPSSRWKRSKPAWGFEPLGAPVVFDKAMQ
mgnify:CR=1 FL=1